MCVCGHACVSPQAPSTFLLGGESEVVSGAWNLTSRLDQMSSGSQESAHHTP